MIPKTNQTPDAPRQRICNPRHPGLAALVVFAIIAVLLLLIVMR
ncbi:hypothetical protein GGQ74_001000 [Desulfobaculum xiamenense]|uniref:Uncharacterized protein n=1 Tax=Desulfobaculum xiamenense TaxID=995050 RepID=A0A846QJX1_9BACT|nr:hypothetical protein [Desulfobaculum xiamenense]NJB67360.1 hypothetical protein [Desulfobaculum xiamenense]